MLKKKKKEWNAENSSEIDEAGRWGRRSVGGLFDAVGGWYVRRPSANICRRRFVSIGDSFYRLAATDAAFTTAGNIYRRQPVYRRMNVSFLSSTSTIKSNNYSIYDSWAIVKVGDNPSR